MNDTKTLMIQGTTSDAGKSFTVAALCRVFANAGRRVAPFKPQNMALNSAVTSDGGEIGRAQALQAQACRVEPHTDMNPVLLKPSSDTGAQVIIHGRAISAMEAQEFHDYKKVAMDAVLVSHARLAKQYDLIAVEGAGSPAEINLREGDIANMGFAEAVDCPVIIVADIDKGGVFAHLVGTLDLLSESEQARTVGFIINRFRGDIALLQPGIDWLEQKTGKPVLAVIPYLDAFYLDAEDAIDTQQVPSSAEHTLLNVVVPVYPRISNHTDLDALRLHPNVNLQFIAPGDTPPPCDLVILPGSKNVRSDLAWFKRRGWHDYLQRHLRYGGKVIGICGGYQMLGASIDDPLGIEDAAGKSEGLNLLPIRTILAEGKITQRKNGSLNLAGRDVAVEGYEIHCGISEFIDASANLITSNEGVEGFVTDDMQILGTYMHGLFDSKDALQSLLSWANNGSDTGNVEAPVDLNQHRETQLERLAEAFEAHVDWSKFNAATGFGVIE